MKRFSTGLISMDKEKVIERVKQYSDLVRQNFRVKKIILYGSYVKGSAKKDSDIDVAVVLSSIDEDLLMSESKLFRLRRNIDARIEPILLEEKNDKSGFLEEILKTGEIIYSADYLYCFKQEIKYINQFFLFSLLFV